MTPVLEATNLSVSWPRGGKIISDFTFSLAPGELVGVIGPSGCGKSTLCLALAGIIPRQLPCRVEGEIRLLGEDLAKLSLPEIASGLGIVFQDPETQLFLPRVRNELAFGPENLGIPAGQIRERMRDAARAAGCEDLLDANPNELSGGQQQLVALAAVLAMKPKVLLLDEVTSQLDPESCRRIQTVIANLLSQGTAVLMVEHNLDQLIHADRVLCLREGVVEVAVAGDFRDTELLTRVYGDYRS